LTFKPEYRAVDIWLTCKHTDIIGQIARSEIVRAVDDHVVISHNSLCVLTGQPALEQLDFNVWIDIAETVARLFEFAAADVFCSVKDLPLQIGEIDAIEIDEPKLSHTSCRQIERSRGAQTAGANAKNARDLKPLLSFSSHFGHNEVPRIPLQFLLR